MRAPSSWGLARTSASSVRTPTPPVAPPRASASSSSTPSPAGTSSSPGRKRKTKVRRAAVDVPGVACAQERGAWKKRLGTEEEHETTGEGGLHVIFGPGGRLFQQHERRRDRRSGGDGRHGRSRRLHRRR